MRVRSAWVPRPGNRASGAAGSAAGAGSGSVSVWDSSTTVIRPLRRRWTECSATPSGPPDHRPPPYRLHTEPGPEHPLAAEGCREGEHSSRPLSWPTRIRGHRSPNGLVPPPNRTGAAHAEQAVYPALTASPWPHGTPAAPRGSRAARPPAAPSAPGFGASCLVGAGFPSAVRSPPNTTGPPGGPVSGLTGALARADPLRPRRTAGGYLADRAKRPRASWPMRAPRTRPAAASSGAMRQRKERDGAG